jgi:hypothetical protein
MLICTASLTLHITMDVAVHNHCSDIELSSPVYFCNCETYKGYSVERIDDGAIMKIGFRYGINQEEYGGILIYEVQRKGNIKHDHQLSTDATPIKTVEDIYKIMRLLVTWKIDFSWNISARILLIEHDNELVLNSDKLAQLYGKIYGISSRYDSRTLLICKNTVLETTYKIIHEKGTELKMNISEEVENEYTMKPMWIDSERQISSLTI